MTEPRGGGKRKAKDFDRIMKLVRARLFDSETPEPKPTVPESITIKEFRASVDNAAGDDPRADLLADLMRPVKFIIIYQKPDKR
jgi:hypothetical protein